MKKLFASMLMFSIVLSACSANNDSSDNGQDESNNDSQTQQSKDNEQKDKDRKSNDSDSKDNDKASNDTNANDDEATQNDSASSSEQNDNQDGNNASMDNQAPSAANNDQASMNNEGTNNQQATMNGGASNNQNATNNQGSSQAQNNVAMNDQNNNVDATQTSSYVAPYQGQNVVPVAQNLARQEVNQQIALQQLPNFETSLEAATAEANQLNGANNPYNDYAIQGEDGNYTYMFSFINQSNPGTYMLVTVDYTGQAKIVDPAYQQ